MRNPPPSDFACEGCFRDKQLRQWIRENGQRGICSWCGSRKYHLVSLLSLGPIFRKAARIYGSRDMPGGQFISELLQDDWDVFSKRIIAKPDRLMHELAISILKAGLSPKHDVDEPEYAGFFERNEPSVVEEWHEGVEDILTKIPSPNAQIEVPRSKAEDWPPTRIEATLLELGETFSAETTFYRARIYKDISRSKPFALAELGSPPPAEVKAQRANRQGQPVLYLANDSRTALAEVRAWKGAYVAIATCVLVRPVTVLNLTKVVGIESPFLDDELAWRMNVVALLRQFAEELSRPIIPGQEGLQYKPSQHACDTVRNAGYAGIMYPSAMGSGQNLVLFDPFAAKPTSIMNVRVFSVNHRASPLPSGAQIYHDWPYNCACQQVEPR